MSAIQPFDSRTAEQVTFARHGATGGAIDRVVVINDDSEPSGGAAGVMLSSVRLLRQRGVPVTLLTGDAGTNPELSAIGVEVAALGGRDIKEGNRAFAAARGIYNPAAAAFVADWIERHDTPRTIYHLHNWHKVLSPAAFVPLRRVASRLILSTHDYFLVCPNGGYSHFPRNAECTLTPMSTACLATSCDKRHYAHKVWRVCRQVARYATFDLSATDATVLAVHEGMISHLVRGGVRRKSIEVLRNPVAPWSTSRVLAERNRDVLFVGRVEPDKGVDILARVCAAIGVRLRVIGSGSLVSELERYSPDVELLGRLTPSAIAEIAAGTRLLVMPTRCRETFGMVAAEASMSGIPVIASRLAPISADLEELGAGISCDPGDEKGLADHILTLMGDDDLIAEMSRNGFAKSSSLAPTPDEWADDLLSVYGRMLDRAAVVPR